MESEQNNFLKENAELGMNGKSKKSEERFFCCGSGKGFNFGRLFLGLLIVLAGSFLLARSMGLVSENFNINMLNFWPFLVIAFGMSLLDTKDRFSFMIALIVFLAVLVMLFAVFANSLSWKGAGARKDVRPVRVTEVQDWRHMQPYQQF